MMGGRNLTVLDFDGVVMRGAVVRVDRDGTVEVRRRADSRAATAEDALAEVVAALDRPPLACVVRTSDAVAGLVRLPIPAGRGRAPDEMAQLLRWELEPLFAQQVAARTLGSILEERGHMDRAQVERVLARMRERRESSGEAKPVRFGAVARELHYVTEAQVAEALAIQERMTPAEDLPVCGWTAQGAAPDGNGESDWLAAGMAAGRRQWWADELRRHGLRLRAVYPRLPAALAALPAGASADVLEVEPHAVAHGVVRDGALASLQILPVSDGETPAQVCRELLDHEARETLVTGSLAGPALVEDLGGRTTLLDPSVRGEAEPGLAGVARHAARSGGPGVAVPARDPSPPLRRRPVAWWCGTVLVLGLIALGADRILEASVRKAAEELAAAKTPWETVDREIRELESARGEAEAILKEIETLEAERDRLSRCRAELEAGIGARRGVLPKLLEVLAEAVTADVFVDRVVEEQPGRIRVEGSALSERAVQVFSGAVAARVAAMRLRIAEPAIRAAPEGPYAFGFLLEPVSEERAS